jgi:hypothetical protein
LRLPVAREGGPLVAGAPERAPGLGHVQITNPPGLPVVSRAEATGEHGEKIVLEIKRQTPTHWYEVLSVDGKTVVGEDLQWFPTPGPPDHPVGFEGMPLLAPAVPHDLSLLVGHVRRPATAVRVAYGDGSRELIDVAPVRGVLGGGLVGFFVYEVTDARRAKQPLRIEALDAAGAVLWRSKIPPGS